ncbi:hypothetical protein OG948_58085 (plasmid) [Embleya sp. NBC_00888]|uniref:hypothetical protein n=1 Tax=Embleya sp. NBC_00888 TaxID=2975960 RepID=UPI002F90EF7F|nr:hypothetical protein OG948_58085 [Embleya sp. NBC_00888]
MVSLLVAELSYTDDAHLTDAKGAILLASTVPARRRRPGHPQPPPPAPGTADAHASIRSGGRTGVITERTGSSIRPGAPGSLWRSRAEGLTGPWTRSRRRRGRTPRGGCRRTPEPR